MKSFKEISKIIDDIIDEDDKRREIRNGLFNKYKERVRVAYETK